MTSDFDDSNSSDNSNL